MENQTKGSEHTPFTETEARIDREEMANNKAPGQSKICKEDLKLGGTLMGTAIKILANKICLTGDWPKDLKYHNLKTLQREI